MTYSVKIPSMAEHCRNPLSLSGDSLVSKVSKVAVELTGSQVGKHSQIHEE